MRQISGFCEVLGSLTCSQKVWEWVYRYCSLAGAFGRHVWLHVHSRCRRSLTVCPVVWPGYNLIQSDSWWRSEFQVSTSSPWAAAAHQKALQCICWGSAVLIYICKPPTSTRCGFGKLLLNLLVKGNSVPVSGKEFPHSCCGPWVLFLLTL